jgi:hypothetical protein
LRRPSRGGTNNWFAAARLEGKGKNDKKGEQEIRETESLIRCGKIKVGQSARNRTYFFFRKLSFETKQALKPSCISTLLLAPPSSSSSSPSFIYIVQAVIYSPDNARKDRRSNISLRCHRVWSSLPEEQRVTDASADGNTPTASVSTVSEYVCVLY